MRRLVRRLASSSGSRCRDRVSPYAVACADCGSSIGGGPSLRARHDRATVWLLGGALLGCLTMLARSSH